MSKRGISAAHLWAVKAGCPKPVYSKEGRFSEIDPVPVEEQKAQERARKRLEKLFQSQTESKTESKT